MTHFGKVIFGHFIEFGHFPIEIPIEAEKKYPHGKEGRRAKTKTVLKPVNQGGKLGSMQNFIFFKFLK